MKAYLVIVLRKISLKTPLLLQNEDVTAGPTLQSSICRLLLR